MPCPRCKTLCTSHDFSDGEVVWQRPFGKDDGRGKVCGACITELRGSLIYSKVARIPPGN